MILSIPLELIHAPETLVPNKCLLFYGLQLTAQSIMSLDIYGIANFEKSSLKKKPSEAASDPKLRGKKKTMLQKVETLKRKDRSCVITINLSGFGDS